MRILEGHGRVGGQPHQDGFVPVGEGPARGVGGVEHPLHPRRHHDRHGEDREVPRGACPGQILFAKARIGGIVRRAPGPPGAQHLSPQPLARRDAQARIGHRGGTDLIAADQGVRAGLPQGKQHPLTPTEGLRPGDDALEHGIQLERGAQPLGESASSAVSWRRRSSSASACRRR